MIVAVDGNICAGKTTLVNGLSLIDDVCVKYESCADNPYLEDYYRDPSKYALSMQLYLFMARYETYQSAMKEAQAGKIVILDRSVYSDAVFARQNYNDGYITEDGYECYMTKRRALLQNLTPPNLVVYLDVDPETCLQRILNLRERKCEQNIPLGYLRGLDTEYKALLEEFACEGSTTTTVCKYPWEPFGHWQDVWRTISEISRELIHTD